MLENKISCSKHYIEWCDVRKEEEEQDLSEPSKNHEEISEALETDTELSSLLSETIGDLCDDDIEKRSGLCIFKRLS